MAKSDKAAVKKGSVFGLVASVLLLTVLAGGGGSFLGMTLAGANAGKTAIKAKADEKPTAVPGAANDVAVRELSPVITNLTAPVNAWVRMQAAIIYDKKAVPNADVMAAEITNDLSAFLKTLSLAQIQGASGLQGLREDLNERAVLRSAGHVRELVIEMLVVQ